MKGNIMGKKLNGKTLDNVKKATDNVSDNRIKDFRDFILKCNIKHIYASYNEQQKELLLYHNPEYRYIASKETLERHHEILDNLRIISSMELRKNTVFKIPANILNINESEIKDICGDSFNGVDCLYIGDDISIEKNDSDNDSDFPEFEHGN